MVPIETSKVEGLRGVKEKLVLIAIPLIKARHWKGTAFFRNGFLKVRFSSTVSARALIKSWPFETSKAPMG